MKKVFMLFAAAVMAVASMTSCASKETKDCIALTQALAEQDVQTAATIAADLYAKKATLTADQAYVLVAGLNGLASMVGDDAATATDYAKKVVEVYDMIAAKDANGLAEATKAGTVDFAPIVEQYKAMFAAQANADADADDEDVEEGEGVTED